MDKVKLLPCGITEEDIWWLKREIWGRRHAGDEDDAQRLERMYALLTRPPIVTEAVERVKLEFYQDYPLSVGYGLSENGRDYAVRDEHFRAAADEFADRLIAARSTIPPQSLGDHFAEYLNRAIQTFDSDPPATDFQRGYLAALKMVREETAAMPRGDGGGA